MSTGEEQQFPDGCQMPYGIIPPAQNNGTCSYISVVDDNGNIEIRSNKPIQENNKGTDSQKMQNNTRKASQRGKQRIRIALIEEAGSSSDEELDDSDVVNQFIKIYDKKVQGKPSFLVLEDVLMRMRLAEELQGRSICQSHAEQQTSPCDIGAHTGCQTDEFLLQCALRSKMLKGQSRGCQATDVKLPESALSTDAKNKLLVSSMRQLSQMANKLSQQQNKQSPASAMQVAPAATPAMADTRTPHITISFVTPNPQQQPLLVTTAVTDENNNFVNNCTNIPTVSCCNHCYPQMPAATNSQYCQLNAFATPQQQLGPTASVCNCCSGSSCCLPMPAFGYCHMPGLATSMGQLTPEYPSTSCTPQGIRNCFAYPMQPCNMSAYPASHCQHCAAFHNDQQQQQQQKQQYVHPGNMEQNPVTIPPAKEPLNEQKQSESTRKMSKKMQNKPLGPSSPTSKLYRARIGRTCLILKPSSINK